MDISRLMGHREGVLVIGNELRPIEITQVEHCPDQNPTFTAIALDGPRARYLSSEFRDVMRKSYGALNPWFNTGNPGIKEVIFNNPATIVIWSDGTKTVVKCQEGDTYSEELGLAMCISKKYLGNKGNFNEVFKKWLPEDVPVRPGLTINLELDGKALGKAVSNAMYNLGKNLVRDYGPETEPEISIETMRHELQNFCNKNYICDKCPLDTPETTCGRGSTFVSDDLESLISDEEIKKSYEKVFGKEEK